MNTFEIVLRDAFLTAQTITKSPKPRVTGSSQTKRGYCGIDIDYVDLMLGLMVCPLLSIEQKKLISLRLSRTKVMPFRALAKIMHTNRELARLRYREGIIKLEKYAIKEHIWDEHRAAKIVEYACSTKFF